MRLFLAFPLPPAVLEGLTAWMDGQRRRFPMLRWSSPATLHLTARFLGDVPAERGLEGLEIARGLSAGDFGFVLDRAGLFVRGRGPGGVYWAGGEFPEDVRRIMRALAVLPDEKGAGGGPRGADPHITVARQGRFDREAVLEDPPPLAGRFEELVLFDSTLTPAGPVHDRAGSIGLHTP